jgi:hypothetical protein
MARAATDAGRDGAAAADRGRSSPGNPAGSAFLKEAGGAAPGCTERDELPVPRGRPQLPEGWQ